MFNHVNWADYALWHREAALVALMAGRMADYHARLEQARNCEKLVSDNFRATKVQP